MKPGGCAVLWVTAATAGALAGCSAPVPVATTPAAPVPAGIIGASAGSLQTAFGRPVLQRIDGSAQVWLYDSRLCRLSVVLYPGPGGAPLVTAAMPIPATIARSACLASLERNHAS